jgi:multiple sugar transport system substrate-binding protein
MTISPARRPGAALSAVALLVAVAVAIPGRAQSRVEITFASGPDDTGSVERLVAAFNAANAGEIEVVWREMPQDTDAHRMALLDDLDANPGGIDLFAADVVWTAQLARSDRIEDVTDRFYDDFDRDAFLPAALGSATYRLRIRGVPWYTDAGLLFYRRDLLAENGFTAPPATWEALAATASAVMAGSEVPGGFVFPGAVGEAGTATAAEFIWSAGGEILGQRLQVTGLVFNDVREVDEVRIRSDEAARGLDIARGLIADGVAPIEVTEFGEREVLDAFLAGEAVFMRSWPYALRVLREAGFTEDRVGVASLPAAGQGGQSASALGGWNLMINAASGDAERDAAWAFIRFLTDPAQQRTRALEAGLLPVLTALYEDPALRAANPLIGIGTQLYAAQLHERPATPIYSELSASVASAFNRTLRGELTGTEATELLQAELQRIAARNR